MVAREFMNVRETWELHDTINVDSVLLGQEQQNGFFPSFAALGRQNSIAFFKRRTEGSVHLAYNNQLSADKADYVIRLFSVGVHFYGPPTPYEAQNVLDVPENVQDYAPIFWTSDLPRHCSLSLEIDQNEVCLAAAAQLSPGYGPRIDGAACGVNGVLTDSMPEMIFANTMGLPKPSSRYWLATDYQGKSKPIDIPRDAPIEAKLEISEIATTLLQVMGGPGNYVFGTGSFTFFNMRYGIQVSLYGYREVQQRGELHAV